MIEMNKNIILNKQRIGLVYILFCVGFLSCSDYLDVVPEGVSRLENAFSMRAQAKKYLYTCYSYLPQHGHPSFDPAIMGGDEIWTVDRNQFTYIGYDGVFLAKGQQNSTNPLLAGWDQMYKALRDCNIFLDNVASVPDLQPQERDRWIGEVKFLKAYYHFYLVQMYGAIPLVKENLPIDANQEQVRVARDPVDSCFSYIVKLIDEAVPMLEPVIINRQAELGRIDRAIALSLKAKVLVTAASPLYNGNIDQATLRNLDGTQLFNQTRMTEKWDAAVKACKEAIELCEGLGFKLYTYPGNPQYRLTDTIKTQLSLRNAFNEKWNSEIIWANTQSMMTDWSILNAYPRLDPAYSGSPIPKQTYGLPIKIAELFYSDNGVPITEDKAWNYNNRFHLRVGDTPEQLYVKTGETTVQLHFNREPRFYAWVGFDCGIWYGQGRLDDKNSGSLFYVSNKQGQLAGVSGIDAGPVTGYSPKKYVHFENIQINNSEYTKKTFPWPVIRLSDLYLLYAEALNEAVDVETNRTEALSYIDKVRDRAGLNTVESSWSSFSSAPDKYKTQSGLRRIIQQERMIELAFEGQRFWDIRRWKTAIDMYRSTIDGWDLKQMQPEYFYRPKVLYKQEFGLKDYFWPIKNNDITVNNNLVQNIGW